MVLLGEGGGASPDPACFCSCCSWIVGKLATKEGVSSTTVVEKEESDWVSGCLDTATGSEEEEVEGGGERTGFMTTFGFGGEATGTGTGAGGVTVTVGALITGGGDSKDIFDGECCEEEKDELLWLSLGLKDVVELVLSSISPQYSSNFCRRLFFGFFFFFCKRGSVPCRVMQKAVETANHMTTITKAVSVTRLPVRDPTSKPNISLSEYEITMLVGWEVGLGVGARVGRFEISLVGLRVGYLVGCRDGSRVGYREGIEEGFSVGYREGQGEGITVGSAVVGLMVLTIVGVKVGVTEGLRLW